MKKNPPDYNMVPDEYWDADDGLGYLNEDELAWLNEFRDECGCEECVENEQPCDAVWQAFTEGVA